MLCAYIIFYIHVFSICTDFCSRNTTFLNACIMHGYFTMERTGALKTLNRAHSIAKKSAPFPLSVVARMLAFPNDRKVSGRKSHMTETSKLSLPEVIRPYPFVHHIPHTNRTLLFVYLCCSVCRLESFVLNFSW